MKDLIPPLAGTGLFGIMWLTSPADTAFVWFLGCGLCAIASGLLFITRNA